MGKKGGVRIIDEHILGTCKHISEMLALRNLQQAMRTFVLLDRESY